MKRFLSIVTFFLLVGCSQKSVRPASSNDPIRVKSGARSYFITGIKIKQSKCKWDACI